MNALEKFGEFLVTNLRDEAIRWHLMLQNGQIREFEVQDIQVRIAALSTEQKKLLLDVVVDLLDHALHDMLAAFQEAHDRNQGIEVFVDGVNIAAQSQMLHGEHLGEGGWIDRFSRYREFGNLGR